MLLYIAISIFVGFIAAWIIKTLELQKVKKELNRTSGLLESERLVKETLRKENAMAFLLKETIENEMGRKLKQAEQALKLMDEDILLLQKSNEENEAFFKESQPEIFDLKMKLIEANNTISRLKSHAGIK